MNQEARQSLNDLEASVLGAAIIMVVLDLRVGGDLELKPRL